jgi:hypothetical protein
MSNFILKKKTENYKKYVKKIEDDVYSRESDSNEIIILTYGVNEINISFSFNLFYLYTYYYILGFYNLNMDCNEELKPSVKKFIENNYFDKDVFDFDDDE